MDISDRTRHHHDMCAVLGRVDMLWADDTDSDMVEVLCRKEAEAAVSFVRNCKRSHERLLPDKTRMDLCDRAPGIRDCRISAFVRRLEYIYARTRRHCQCAALVNREVVVSSLWIVFLQLYVLQGSNVRHRHVGRSSLSFDIRGDIAVVRGCLGGTDLARWSCHSGTECRSAECKPSTVLNDILFGKHGHMVVGCHTACRNLG